VAGAREAEVAPRDCALLLAVPLTLATFAPAYLDDERDFCRQFTSGRAELPPRAVWLMFERAMRTIERSACQVAARGVTVVRGARLTDWSAALRQFRVVTLVAHWRFTPFIAEDILDASSLRDYAREQDNALAATLGATVATGDSNADIAQKLNTICAPATRRLEAADRRGDPADRGPTRPVLELNVPGLRHAPAIELADRMHTVLEVLEATPMHYAGVIDLSVCNSILLAEALRRKRDPLLIACGEFRARLDFHMVRYRVLIEQLHRRAARYSDLLQLLTRS